VKDLSLQLVDTFADVIGDFTDKRAENTGKVMFLRDLTLN
jgi:hypothetical protein